jgi:hypothetical protein
MRGGAVAEADAGQRGGRGLAGLGHVRRVEEGADHYVLERGHLVEGTQFLKRPADAEPADLVRAQPGGVAPVEPHAAGVGKGEAGDQVEQRRLAGAVRPDDAHQLARAHREGDVAISHDATEALGEARDLEQRRWMRLGRPHAADSRRTPALAATARQRTSPISPAGRKTAITMMSAP